jgi:hypothetical protein
MDIFFPRKKIVLDCFTSHQAAYDLFPIAPTRDHAPQWWKSMPKTRSEKADDMYALTTLKSCRGLIDFYQNGFAIPLWSDLSIQVGTVDQPYYRYQFADQVSAVIKHNSIQWDSWLSPVEWVNLKIISPWAIHNRHDTKFLFTDPTWNRTNFKDYTLLNGVTEFKHQHASHINIMVPYAQGSQFRTFQLEAGDPIAMLMPLSEKAIELKHHLVSHEEFHRKQIQIVKFQNNWSFVKKNKESQCPFKPG